MKLFHFLALLACLVYLSLLTILLLTPNPGAVIGLKDGPRFPWGDRGVHFTALATLTLLAHAVRWPRRPNRTLVLLLVAYGVATESLQAFVPPRCVELADYAENISGVLAGSALAWLFWRIFVRNDSNLATELARPALVESSSR